MTEENKVTTIFTEQQIHRAINGLQNAAVLSGALVQTHTAEIKDTKPGELAQLMVLMKDLLALANDAKSGVQVMYDRLSQHVVPEAMDEQGLESLTVEDYRLEVRGQLRVSCLKENKPALHTWLKENGMGDLVAETVNSSSLKSMVKNAMEDGTEFPAEIVKIDPYKQAVIVKR